MLQNRWPKCSCSNSTQGDIPEDGWTIDAVKQQTGFQPIFLPLPADQIIWVCPSCQRKLLELVREIEKILGIERVSIGHYFEELIPASESITLGQIIRTSTSTKR